MSDSVSLAKKLLALSSSPVLAEAEAAATRAHKLLTEETLPLTYTVRPGTTFNGCPSQHLLSTYRWAAARTFRSAGNVRFTEAQRLRGSNTLLQGYLLFEQSGWTFVLPLKALDIE